MTIDDVARRYAVAVSPTLLSLINPADPDDPIARQFLPRLEELQSLPRERADPIGDAAHSPVPGIVHRHPDRVLFKAVAACPVYCRFCFRRETVGQGQGLSQAQFDAAFAYIESRPEIWEVILTGGDPFILSPRRAADVSRRLAAIPHVTVIRWHTRVPVVDPGRVTDDLVAALLAPGATPWVAIHANHPREFSQEACRAIARLADAGIPLVSQSVLLKGVNDDAVTLEALMRAFVQHRIKPYYLHHPDLAPGTSHFRVTIEEGQKLVAGLRGRISGLCQPTYILDIPGGYGKTPVAAAMVSGGDGCYTVRDFRGGEHAYPPDQS